jgi:lipopolysaccharide transport system ATP-binding protein
MSSSKAIRVENLSKLYRLGTPDDLTVSGANPLARLIAKPLQNFRKYRSLYTFTEQELSGQKSGKDLLWALRDISFDVEAGQAVGFVGANGAGKSTLLKILSRITPPTLGRAIIRGRVSCLIEVGTGFHPELTGRENIYMSATILGMRKAEVDRKLDEIIDFSGVGAFIDTPVKRYSSGMSVRLAFGVMANLEPEILIVDEVLAVGDAEFQRKCLNKMSGIGKEGRTVLFVSHNMAAVTRLCNRALLIRGGRVAMDGSAEEVVHAHIAGGRSDTTSREWPDINMAPGDDSVRLRALRVVDASGAALSSVRRSQAIGLQLSYDVLEPHAVLSPFFTLVSDAGVELFSTSDPDPGSIKVPRQIGRYVSTAWIPANFLSDGCHYVGIAMRSMQKQYRPFVERDSISFTVVDDSEHVLGASWWEGRLSGVIRPELNWTTEYVLPQMVIKG